MSCSLTRQQKRFTGALRESDTEAASDAGASQGFPPRVFALSAPIFKVLNWRLRSSSPKVQVSDQMNKPSCEARKLVSPRFEDSGGL